MEDNNVVKIFGLTKNIKGITVLNNVNLNLERGKGYGIIGRNGSGKSMLFKAICGLINPTEGDIKVFNKTINNGNFPDSTGIIIENPGFLLQYSGFKNLKILASINNTISDEKINETIALVGLDPKNKKSVRKYSLGMKQRLGIAQALMEEPKLLILDEPMNGLDSEGVKQIRELFLELKLKGVTILIASHNSEDINEICDHVYNMENGVLSECIKPITRSVVEG